ncbi:MAG: alpha/beta hydrolase [Pseudomonadales bacterium]
MIDYPALYNSPESEARFRSAYETLLKSWQIEVSSTWVNTDFGETHVLVAGTSSAPPIVSVPGAQGTAAMWGHVASTLASDRSIYCVDLIDQVGLSRPKRVMSNPEDGDHWFRQTMDGLGLDYFDLVGNSLGSFIAAKFASAYSERVRSLVLTAPAATVASVSPAYVLKVLTSMNIPIKKIKTRFLLGTGAGSVGPDDLLFRVLNSAMLESRLVSKLLPRALSSRELGALTMPVLLIQGQKDRVNAGSAEENCQRAKLSVQRLTCETLADAGHLWSPAQFLRAGEMIKEFIRSAIPLY